MLEENTEYLLNIIPNAHNWNRIELVNKGYSSDKKYYIITNDGEQLILRLSDISEYEKKKKEYEIIKKYSTIGFKMSMPINFGTTEDEKFVYMLLTWIEGGDLENVLAKLPVKIQYQLGRKAGTILKSIHNLKVDKNDIPKGTKLEKKLWQLERYINSSHRVPNDEVAIAFLKENINKMWTNPPVYAHGDFHPGNLIYTPEGDIGVIDFNRWEVGEPYEEFYKLESFGIEISIPYCIGQIDAYFEDNIPEEFWQVQAVYVAHSALFSIEWATNFSEEDVNGMIRRWETSYENYDGFSRIIPRWYEEGIKKLDKKEF